GGRGRVPARVRGDPYAGSAARTRWRHRRPTQYRGVTVKLLIPDTISLELDVPGEVEVITYAVAEPIPQQHRDAEAIVLWMNPADRMRALPAELPQLRWVQGLLAGMDPVVNIGFDEQIIMTSGTGLHNGPVAEHTLALVLAAARRLDLAFTAQA